MWSLAKAQAWIIEGAEPAEGIEVPLVEALGLVLAEPAVADVDQPPFDRAACDGYALRGDDATQGTRLRLIKRHRGQTCGEVELGAGEATLVAAGEAMPVGADTVLRVEQGLAESASAATSPGSELEVLRIGDSPRRSRNGEALGALPGHDGPRDRNIIPRGAALRAGSLLAPAGTRITIPLVGVLAAQGWIHPICHRRVRVAVLAVGAELVNPGEAPVLHFERNAAGPALAIPCIHRFGATAHDLGAVAPNPRARRRSRSGADRSHRRHPGSQ